MHAKLFLPRCLKVSFWIVGNKNYFSIYNYIPEQIAAAKGRLTLFVAALGKVSPGGHSSLVQKRLRQRSPMQSQRDAEGPSVPLL